MDLGPGRGLTRPDVGNLFAATVPVFADYAPRIAALAELGGAVPGALDARLAPDGFGAGEHLVVAQGFALRTVFPVLGREAPELSTDAPTASGIARRHAELVAILDGVAPDDFADAERRRVSHVAGEARLDQGAADYVHLFGVPNFFFHVTMGYASLRAAGADVGKARFDGLHAYASGFSFAV